MLVKPPTIKFPQPKVGDTTGGSGKGGGGAAQQGAVKEHIKSTGWVGVPKVPSSMKPLIVASLTVGQHPPTQMRPGSLRLHHTQPVETSSHAEMRRSL